MAEIDWRAILEPRHAWNSRAIMAVFATFGLPRSLLDLGSGTGAMVGVARALKIEAVGVDQIAELPDLAYDLAVPFDLERKFQCVVSVETAEHIGPDFVDVYVGNIARHLAHSGVLIFSAAPPGQQGNGHLNCQPAYYWREKFHKHGISYREELTNRLRLAWHVIPMPMMWLAANVQVFDHGPTDL